MGSCGVAGQWHQCPALSRIQAEKPNPAGRGDATCIAGLPPSLWFLGKLLCLALLEQGLEQVVSRGPCQPQPLWDYSYCYRGCYFKTTNWQGRMKMQGKGT